MRIPEPELMDEWEQARAYALADFEEPHSQFIRLFRECFPSEEISGFVLDLGCGPADVSIRFAKAYSACRVIGLDGAQAMLHYGAEAIKQAKMAERVEIFQRYLPDELPPLRDYQAVISNSLLHHLRVPGVLWETIKTSAKPGTVVFVMDLMRPHSEDVARALVTEYAADEPEVLKRDFYHSLLAAYTVDEVAFQLKENRLEHLCVRPVSDRHLIVAGRL